jgi:hypothetical protein
MMNERIKELILEAGFPKFDEMYVVSDGKELEKFAELIVLECASICYNSGLKDPDTHAQNLMFHFNIDNCRNDK